jgi:hypothetical protein
MALLLVLGSWLALAARGEEGGPVKVSVVAILASEQPTKEEDPRLTCVAREIRKMDKNLVGFRMGKINCKSLPVGSDYQAFDLVGDQKVLVKVEQGANRDGWVELKIKPPMLGEINYRTVCGKFLPIITRYRTAQNELLILAIRVQPCPGK